MNENNWMQKMAETPTSRLAKEMGVGRFVIVTQDNVTTLGFYHETKAGQLLPPGTAIHDALSNEFYCRVAQMPETKDGIEGLARDLVLQGRPNAPACAALTS